MGLFSGLFDFFSSDSSMTNFESTSISACDSDSINPANGLPMAGCVDIEGNPYGTSSSDDSFAHSSSFDDDSLSSSSMMDDSFDSMSMFDDSFDSTSMFDDSFSSGFSDDW